VGTHTDAFFRRMGRLFRENDAYEALAKLKDEVLEELF
jgi:hypothetical protein